jgi:hypothetical protein
MCGLRPAELCTHLLAALDASEGRRRKRKRDTTPDAIGLGIRHDLLEAVIHDDPEPDAFEAWLIARCAAPPSGEASGPVRAMATSLLAEWRLALDSGEFRSWLAAGAPSDDRP